jgi:hypothetical protein
MAFIYLDLVVPEPEVPEPEEPMVPDPPEELELPPGDPLAPEVSVARRSQPTAVRLKASSISKTFDVLLSKFIPVPFNEVDGAPFLTISLSISSLNAFASGLSFQRSFRANQRKNAFTPFLIAIRKKANRVCVKLTSVG